MKVTNIRTVERYRDEIIAGDEIQFMEIEEDGKDGINNQPTKVKKVFLGGTISDKEYDWRNELIPKLNIDYFNPVVDNWDEKAILIEKEAKRFSDFQLYVITPFMTGVYSIAEIVNLSNEDPNSAVLCILKEYKGKTFSDSQYLSIMRVANLVKEKGVKCFSSLDDVALYLNNN